MRAVNKATEDYIHDNMYGDVRVLALKSRGTPGVDLDYALDQIAGRQTARRKIPSWSRVEGIIYPPHVSLEQCSSEKTAVYKASLSARLCGRGTLVDLAGGFGVDFVFMSPHFLRAVYVERQEGLCETARRNFRVLGLDNATVFNVSAEDYLRDMTYADVIYLDPSRRGEGGRRKYAMEDCSPDVVGMKELLLSKSTHVIVKLSPMLDWRSAASALGNSVSEIHVVAVGNECKELVIVMTREYAGDIRMFCVNDSDIVSFDVRREGERYVLPCSYGVEGLCEEDLHARPLYLYEPNVSIMKAGCYGYVGQKYGVKEISACSHLFVSAERLDGFPGRRFKVETVTGMSGRAAVKALSGVGQANIAARNFPMTVAALRKRLRLREGGDVYIFATTLSSRRHVLLICTKA